ncbi:lipase family protein [Nonomuraea sp. NEAU-A123]|uniref:lipase family protein n=1 Tax=Nonomuraea sp. NEAU-A123 TaxID=2839649 RepID=UPI001BE4DB97|nr:lipase family protein [Nonomuraea sp. NEAU-A123]MBT2227284.1 lipase family protein [Nonomuraea sp. NEAU-A123]
MTHITPRLAGHWVRRLLYGLVAMALAVGSATAPAHADRARLDVPSATNAVNGPGRLVSSQTLPEGLWLPGTGAAYRITYTSTPADKSSAGLVVVAGAVFIPRGTAPQGGWPVIGWAHPTVGVADGCAPSVVGRPQGDIDFLSAWLRAGYAIAATDYEGLGTPGPHPYLNGLSEAYGVIDAVRAAPAADPKRSLSSTWLGVGYSQGGQATLFTGALQESYAPELDYRGSIAIAPPSQWRTLISVAQPFDFDPAKPASPFVFLVLEMLRVAHPGTIDPGDYLTPAGIRFFPEVQNNLCVGALVQRMAGHLNGEFFDMDAAEQETFTRLLVKDAEIPIVRHEKPLYIAHGTADTLVFPPASQTTARLLAEAGTDVTFRFYPGVDHFGIAAAALPDLLAWAADRLNDKAG